MLKVLVYVLPEAQYSGSKGWSEWCAEGEAQMKHKSSLESHGQHLRLNGQVPCPLSTTTKRWRKTPQAYSP
jgi:hypothetical protein